MSGATMKDKRRCESCGHWYGPRDSYPDLRIVPVNGYKPIQVGDCTKMPAWVETVPSHYCGWYEARDAGGEP